MTNLNQKVFLAINISKKPLKYNDISYQNWIYSLYIAPTNYSINNISLINRLRCLNCKKIVIWDIYPLYTESKSTLIENNIPYYPVSKDNPFYLKRTISLKDFISKNNLEMLTSKTVKHFEDENLLNYSIFIFNSLPLPFIVGVFEISKILLTPGDNSKRGILSPVHNRLSQFITCMEGMGSNTVFDSYMNYMKFANRPIFNYLDKNRSFKLEDINYLYKIMESYFKWKLNVKQEITNFEWDLRKELDLTPRDDKLFILEEFLEYYKQSSLSNNEND